MAIGSTHFSSRPPHAPEGAEFAIYIKFEKGSKNPGRVFRAADQMIRALQKLDRVLCDSIDSNIEPILLLEDIEGGSIKAWFRSVLETTDDQALKDLNWRAIVGEYLVRAKYTYIRWVNKESGDIVNLSREIKDIAETTDVLRFPAYSPPSVQELSDCTNDMEKAKSFLDEKDKIIYIGPDGKEFEFDLGIRWAPDHLIDISIKETRVFDRVPMILIVKKPDYLGASKWDFRHGSKTISAKIDDSIWLHSFQQRRIDVRPGDAISCIVKIENCYGYEMELIKENHTILKILGIIPNHANMRDLFDDD
ncbi:MAG: hypothetical protein VYB54_15275 [Pseudomonadota bacterium]|nr:hypothetical protein [Pseudomonadota bacterium]